VRGDLAQDRAAFDPGGHRPPGRQARRHRVPRRCRRAKRGALDAFVLPDLLGTCRTRRNSRGRLCSRSCVAVERLDDVFVDAQAFVDIRPSPPFSDRIETACSSRHPLREARHRARTESEWEMTRFEDGELLDYLRRAWRQSRRKHCTTTVEYESEVSARSPKASNERTRHPLVRQAAALVRRRHARGLLQS
jgi:hypothetical protein